MFELGERVADDERAVLYRATDASDRHRVLLKVMTSRQPRAEDLATLQHELMFAPALASSKAIKPLAITNFEDRRALILEDFEGVALADLLGEPLEVGRLLRIAIEMAQALADVHEHGIVHKDITPAHVLVHPHTGEVKITGFGIASRLLREERAVRSPDRIEGSLPYMSPEQTGRMNRAIDTRTDLYSFGITLYTMLTGVRPFEASDPLEWVHSHIARAPEPPIERVSTIPKVLSDLAMKLLAKAAEDRYETARGLAVDLRECLTRWNATHTIEPFTLAEHDVSDRLQIAQTLHGREKEIAVLHDAFERTATTGATSLTLVSGYSGIGKSTLVHELHKPVIRKRGFFIGAKADQYRRNIPYSSILPALTDLVLEVLTQSEAQIGEWKQRLSEALGTNGGVLVDVLPQLELVIGKQPTVAALPQTQSRNRFHRVISRFIGVFARREHPVALFLDDLQWADAGSLELLSFLVTDPDTTHLAIVGAYRDNEVSPTHPLSMRLAALRKAGALMDEIALPPLSTDDTAKLIANTLHSSLDEAHPLAVLVNTKTGGNPFFVIQFLKTLHQDALLTFDSKALAWRWDVERIAARGYTDNVVELMVTKLERLGPETREALRLAACIGNVADVATLELLSGQSRDELRRSLWEAVSEGLIQDLGDRYRFLHDRIHQAAYSLVEPGERPRMHLRIGRLLLRDDDAHLRDARLFDIVNHFTLGASLLTDDREKRIVAESMLHAARRAKSSNAYAAAVAFLATPMSFLDESSWDSDYELMVALHLERAECESLAGEFPEAEEHLQNLHRRARTTTAKIAAFGLETKLHTIRGAMAQAVETGLSALKLTGSAATFNWTAHPAQEEALAAYARVWTELADCPIGNLVDLPQLVDPDMKAAMEIASVIVDAALYTDANLLTLVASFMVDTSLRFGNDDTSPLGYTVFAMIIGRGFGRYQDAHEFGKVALDLVERDGIALHKAKICVLIGVVIDFWSTPYRSSVEILEKGFTAGVEGGDHVSASYNSANLVALELIAGDPLDEVYRASTARLEFVRKVKFDEFGDVIVAMRRCIQNLRGLTNDASTFDGEDFDQKAFEEVLPTVRTPFAVCWYYIIKTQARVIFGDYAEAVRAGTKAKELLWTTPSFVTLPEFYTYLALALAAHYPDVGPDQQAEYLTTLREHERELGVWAGFCPENFAGKHALVSAEVARLEGRNDEASKLYELAVSASRVGGLVQNEALAYETAATFYRQRGFGSFADAYLREARDGYGRWGALGKVAQIDRRFPQVAVPRTSTNVDTLTSRTEQMDLMSVVKASQRISREIDLATLVRRLMQVVLEQSGAELGYLLLVRDDALRIEVEAKIEGREIATTILPSIPIATSSLVPTGVVQYVFRSGERVILSDARDPAHVGRFANEGYFEAQKPRSVLCVPIVRQTEPMGLLYLENNLVTGAFTSERLTALELLASQAAISLENAMLIGRERSARAAAERAEHRARFIADAGVILSETLEVEKILSRLAQLCAEKLADWCVIDLVESGVIRRVAGVHADPRKQPLMEELQRRFPPTWDSADPASVVIRSGEPILRSAAGERSLRADSESDEHAQLIRELGTGTRLVVPLRVRAHTIGAITLGAGITELRAEYGLADLELAEELARRAATAIDNARLYRDVGETATRLRVVLTQLPASVWTIDRDLRFTSNVGAGLSRLGLDQDAFVGQTIMEVLGTHDRQHPSVAPVLRVIGSGEAATYESEWNEHTFLNYVEPLHDKGLHEGGGDIVGALGLTFDITERKAAEAALHRAEEQLRESQKMDAIGRLAGGIAHDFNNLLAVILCYCDLMIARSKPSDSGYREFEEIRKASLRAGDLTSQLLAFSRRQVVETRVVDVGEVVRSVTQMLSRVIGEDIELAVLPGATGGTSFRVKADPSQLVQVIMNLVVNARDAMPGGGRLSIELERIELDAAHAKTHGDARPGDYVVLSVVDTGAGMDDVTRARIFEPFFTTKEFGKGTGLGLAMVFGIVQQSGGHIVVDSAPGEGTTFRIHLPATEERMAPSQPPHELARPTSSATVLLVEDDESLRVVVRQVLEQAGFHVLAAGGAFAALEIAKSYEATIDLLLTDEVMPNMHGRELSTRIASVHRETRVLSMSGYTDRPLVHTLGPGASFIQKPFTPSALIQKIREVLASRSN